MDLFEKYGASPRELAMYSHSPHKVHERVIRKLQEMDPPKIRVALGTADMDTSSHFITRIEPSQTSRAIAEKTIASQYVFALLWDKYLKDQNSEMEALYRRSLNNSNMAAVAGWVFESRMHQLFRSGRTIQLFPIRRSSLGPVNVIYRDYNASRQRLDPTPLTLHASPDCLFREGEQLTSGKYYRAPKVNFPAVDSLFFIEPPDEPSPILLMFQITQNHSEHDANSLGLDAVGRLVPPNTRKWYVVVTPVDIEPGIKVARKYFSDQGVDVKNVEGADALLRVFHCLIPTQNMFLHESDLEPGLLQL